MLRKCGAYPNSLERYLRQGHEQYLMPKVIVPVIQQTFLIREKEVHFSFMWKENSRRLQVMQNS